MKKFLKGVLIVYLAALIICNSVSLVTEKVASGQDQDVVKKESSLSAEEKKSVQNKYSSAGKATARFILAPFIEAANAVAKNNHELQNREPWTIDESFKIPPKIEVPSIEERMKDVNDMADKVKKEQSKNK